MNVLKVNKEEIHSSLTSSLSLNSHVLSIPIHYFRLYSNRVVSSLFILLFIDSLPSTNAICIHSIVYSVIRDVPVHCSFAFMFLMFVFVVSV